MIHGMNNKYLFRAELQPNSSEARVISDEDECEQDAPEPPANANRMHLNHLLTE